MWIICADKNLLGKSPIQKPAPVRPSYGIGAERQSNNKLYGKSTDPKESGLTFQPAFTLCALKRVEEKWQVFKKKTRPLLCFLILKKMAIHSHFKTGPNANFSGSYVVYRFDLEKVNKIGIIANKLDSKLIKSI
ncbi:hypothetical protein TNIN_299321 [Trichonephila inaurata madagascariensis]|uniref:Uncharacterized protein n=1 Tax=Trichonephila inaurata madagascariensis TaxID=2747483 RepID=A0A8X7BSH4_9ARAC|nr:hypothetical protein TNIN_299321 [Trichonephila inaurata madagascariensis]